MSADALSDIAFERYFVLLRELLPHGLDFYICDLAGEVQAADAANTAQMPRTRVRTDHAIKQVVLGNAARLAADRGIDDITYVMEIRTPADEPVGLLVGVGSAGVAAGENGVSAHRVNSVFESVLACIEKEFRLVSELNTMTQELADRYEELNLVYDAADESVSVEDEAVTLKQLIENYVNYLDVDMVAIIYPQHERILCATGRRDPVHEPYELIRRLSGDYLSKAREQGECLLINDITDRRRDELSLEMPYKILSCPVTNARGGVDGILICLNHIYRHDFFNSDRNLLKAMARKVAKITQSHYDAQTGLMNRHAFETVLQGAVNSAREEGLFHCILYVDIDQLQVLNESFGREAGDHAIRTAGELLRRKLRNTDTVSYLGEGRYGVLLVQCSIDQGMLVSQSLRDAVAGGAVEWNGMPLDISVSIGITMIEPHVQTVTQVMEAAELARDAAKEQGSGQLQAFRQDDTDLVARKNQMQCVMRIQKALREDRFLLYCQQIRPVGGSAERYHFEVLLRLLGTEGEIVGPNQFIPPAEHFNLMPAIDRWVIESTLSTLAGSGVGMASGEGTVSINLSGQSLASDELVDFISEQLKVHGIAPANICFEVTETAAIGNRTTALAIIQQLKAIGCKFSLDDFGTGLSSFSYLKELPVDYVKIDGSFVRQILDDNVSHAMVASVNQIGHVMGLQTIAEFVENDAIAERLAAMGVDYLQGYGIGKPQPLADYLADLRAADRASAG